MAALRVGDVMGAGVGTGLRFGARTCVIAGCGLVLAQCGQAGSKVDPKYGVAASPRVVQPGEPVPKGGGIYRVGKPYTIAGRTYMPEENVRYSAEGIASWYGEDFHGRLTANREVYDMDAISAAHPTLPIPSYARVTNLANKRSIIVRVNDRGPYHKDRLIDVSVRTAKLLGFYENGVARVRVDYVGPASLAGSDDSKLEATLRRGVPAPGPAEVKVASAQPFGSPIARASSTIRGPVPTPSGRPFELGLGDRSASTVRSDARRNTEVARAALPPAATASTRAPARTATASQPTSFEARFAPARELPAAPSRIEPVPAFAPTAGDGSSRALVTGRGLY